MIKVLVVWPVGMPVFSSDFWRNAWIYEIESFLSSNLSKEYQIDVFDGSKENGFEKYLRTIQEQKYDIVGCVASLDSMDGFEKTIKYTRLCSEDTKIFVYGLACLLQPEYFKKLDINAFVCKGTDFEVAFLSFIMNCNNTAMVEGCFVKNNKNIWQESRKGHYSTAENWRFILPERCRVSGKVIRMTIARGCIGNCTFCCCPILHGVSERRKSIGDTINYLKTLNETTVKNNVVEFAAPSFTADRKWVVGFCNKLIEEQIGIVWRCVTRIDMLDEELVKLMAAAGCCRIGLGLETLTLEEQKRIHKGFNEEKTKQIILLLRKYSIEPLIFLIAGLPGQKMEDFISTYNLVKAWGGVPRVTAYVNYNLLDLNDVIRASMDSNMTTSSLADYDGTERRNYMSYILNTCDNDKIQVEKYR